MYGIPSEGALYWALMRYGEIMTISKSRLTKMRTDTRQATSTLTQLSDETVANSNGRNSRLARNSSSRRRSSDKSNLNENAIERVTENETVLNELEECLAIVESSGRSAWLKAFMHMSNQLRTFYPPPRESAASKQKIPSYDVVFDGPSQESMKTVKGDNFVGKLAGMRKVRTKK